MNYKKSYYLTHPWEVVAEFARSVKWFIERGSRGYAECDVWNLSHYLSSWLPGALRGLKNGESYPTSFDGWCNGMTPKKWNKILEQMAQGFEETNIKGTKDFPKRWLKEDRKRRKQRDLFSFWFWNLWS